MIIRLRYKKHFIQSVAMNPVIIADCPLEIENYVILSAAMNPVVIYIVLIKYNINGYKCFLFNISDVVRWWRCFGFYNYFTSPMWRKNYINMINKDLSNYFYIFEL